MKVYELAKELGIDSISLLDKLKELKIIVKSHMSALSEEEITLTRNALKKNADAKKPPVRIRKKAVAESAPAGDKKTPIIRKRHKTTEQEPVQETILNAPPYQDPVLEEKTEEPLFSSPVSSTLIEESLPKEEMPLEAITEEKNEEKLPLQPLIEEKKVKPAIVLTPRPIAPRRSILTIVEAKAPAAKPVIRSAPAAGVKGTSTQDTEGFRIIKMTKENLDEMVQEEAAKRKPSVREGDLSKEDVRFADYRKKELVFLPKRKRIPVGKTLKQTQITVSKAQKRIIDIQETISLTALADKLSLKAVELVRKLFSNGQMANINSVLDFDTASLLCSEYQYEARNVTFNEEAVLNLTNDPAKTIARPPIVTIMGHVDHGKTTLLDTIRKANIVATEAGGITQHIGAYTVFHHDQPITFIDTPGHEAFTEMRARGANATDIVVLVVSADDGVMPQTKEAMSHAKAAGVPIIVAVNKIDKPNAQPQKVQQALGDLGLLAEEWGGETIYVPVSALKGTNIDKLLESILLQAEVLELKANPHQPAQGIILEAKLDKGRGPLFTALIKEGTLRVGDFLLSGVQCGKVKALTNEHSKMIKEVTPGFAVEVLGLEGVPTAGDLLFSPETEEKMRSISKNRLDTSKRKAAISTGKISLDDLFSKIQSGDLKELNVLIKADMMGSAEVIRDSLNKLSNPQVKIKVLLSAAGGISESDVLLASASKAIIIGFNVRPESKARQLAEAENIEIKTYNIIYELLDEVKKSMIGLLDKKKVEKFLGRAEVRQVFQVPKAGAVAGCFIIEGKMIRGCQVRLLRDSRVLFEGKMSSLKRFKDDAKEVLSGFECGISLENYNDIKPSDVIEGYFFEYLTPEMKSL